jgi:hypothetical protein
MFYLLSPHRELQSMWWAPEEMVEKCKGRFFNLILIQKLKTDVLCTMTSQAMQWKASLSPRRAQTPQDDICIVLGHEQSSLTRQQRSQSFLAAPQSDTSPVWYRIRLQFGEREGKNETMHLGRQELLFRSHMIDWEPLVTATYQWSLLVNRAEGW